MKVIDKYLIREFFRNFLGSLLFFTLLLLVVRFSEKELGKFVSRNMTVWSSILSLLYQTPGFIIQVAPPSALFAAFFSLGKMTQNNEIMAMKAVGISLYRVFKPIFIAALALSIVMIIFNDQVVTWAYKQDAQLSENRSYSAEIETNVVFSSSGNRVIYAHIVYLNNKRMQNLMIQEFKENNKLEREIFAQEASWETQDWILKNGTIRTFRDDTWEEKPFDQYRITIREDPAVMVKSGMELKEMSFVELLEIIENKKMGGKTIRKDMVAIHSKFSFPFACFVMVLLGAPLFVMFGKAGTAVGFLLTMFISFLYWGIAIAFFEALGNNGILPPVISCWTANFIFGIAGIILVYKVKK
ncbi:LptF/LptG family permease [Candidatus Poribacteria bacterium]|nr:LptF/LptG family permease [Candidatus Poribacteria bacterium]